MKANPGRLPAEAIGKQVRVRLQRDLDAGVTRYRLWKADTTNWSRTGFPFDVAEYEVAH